MLIQEIINSIETFAPLSLQESYDNSGLICGNTSAEAKGALLTLDCTEAIVDEAIKQKCNLIIAHHPIVFTGLKKITGRTYVERVLIKAIKNDIAIYAAHTNLDSVENGVNKMICDKLRLQNCRILAPKQGLLKKLITFCPVEKAEYVRTALFAAGAGHIGNYDECSFNSEGLGTFKANKGAQPYVGKIGKQQKESEQKIETILPAHLEKKVLKALVEAHPYEEVAYDIFPLTNLHKNIGSGMVGELKKGLSEKAFLDQLKKLMKTESIRYTNLLGKKVKKVAVCGGSGGFLLADAIAAGADVFVTADFKYHQFFDADNKLVIADIGHYESEQFTPQIFYNIISTNFPKFAVRLSKIRTNPINYL